MNPLHSVRILVAAGYVLIWVFRMARHQVPSLVAVPILCVMGCSLASDAPWSWSTYAASIIAAILAVNGRGGGKWWRKIWSRGGDALTDVARESFRREVSGAA